MYETEKILESFFDFSNEIPVEEVYFGKTSNLKKIEKLLGPVITFCHGVYDGTFKKDINSTKEVKEIESLFAKEFNIGEFSLTFYTIHYINSASFSPNAFTVPSSLQFLKRSKDNKKIVDASNSYVGVNVDIALVATLDMSAEELMAVILHEIGHCMNASVFNFLAHLPGTKFIKFFKDANVSTKITTGISFGLNTIFGKRIAKFKDALFKKINELLSEYPDFNAIMKKFSVYTANLLELISPFLSVVSVIKSPISALMSFIEPHSLFGYQTERFSDSFATAYGYGVGMATFANKLQRHKGSIVSDVNESMPAFGIGRDMADVSMKIVGMLSDPHPSDPSRIINQLNKMKRDLKDPNLDSKVRSELEDSIERLEKIIKDEVLNEKNYKAGSGSSHIKLLYNMLIIKVFKGKMDPRELLNINNHYEL